MSRAVAQIRCYNCGRLGARDAASCERCVANFRALCECGAELSIFDDHCGSCQAPHVPRRMPPAKHPLVRTAKWVALALVVGSVAYVVLSPREVPPWLLKTQSYEKYSDADYEAAARGYRELTERTPADPEGWYMLGVSMQKLGHGADAWMPIVERAVLLAPDLYVARSLLAHQELARGRIDRALEHAEAAANSPQADGRAYQLLAEIELRRPRPDLPRVQATLERARAQGLDTPEVKLLLAEVSLRLYGVQATRAGRLPPGISVTLREAASALDELSARLGDPVGVSTARARIQLALGEFDMAYASADSALSQAADGTPRKTLAEIRVLRGMALHARGNRADASADFATALKDAPEARTAAQIGTFLVGVGDVASARALLAAAGPSDTTGGVLAVFAGLLLSEGHADEAAVQIDAARGLAPSEASFAEIQGAVRIAQGKPQEARAAYADAARLAPSLVGPRVGEIIATLAATPADASREQALARAAADLDALRSQHGDDARVLLATGRVRIAAGDDEKALEALEKAKDAAPANSEVWRLLAEARRRSKAPGALAQAASAYARARLLEPNEAGLVLAEAEARLASGDAGTAAAACTEFLREHPDDMPVIALRARAYRQLAMWPSAVADLRRLRTALRDDEGILEQLVDTMFRAGDAEGARRVIMEVSARVSPATKHVLDFVAALHAGDAGRAIEELRLAGPGTLLAEVQLAAGSVSDAVETLRALHAQHPEDAHATRLLVLALVDDDPPVPDRVAEAREVAASLPADAAAGVRDLVEGRLLLAERKYAAAAERLASASRAMPADSFAAFYLGEALYQTGERADSLAAFRRSANMPGVLPSMREIVAMRLLGAARETKDESAAETLAREAVRLSPRSGLAAEWLAELLQNRGDPAGAADIATQALHLADITPERSRRLRLVAAMARLRNGQYVEAKVLLDALDETEKSKALARLIAAFADLGAGRAEEADRVFAAVLASEPTQSAAQLGRVEAALATSRTADAVALVDAWRAAHASDRGFVVTASNLLVRRGRLEEAIALTKRALEASPDDTAFAVAHGRALAAAGRHAQAAADLRAVVARLPAERRVWPELVFARFQLGGPELAADAIATARRILAGASPGTPEALAARVLEAEALLAARRVSEAEAAAREVVKRWETTPSPPEERWYEARIRFVLGSAALSSVRRLGEAIDQLDRSTRLDPTDDDAANNLAWALGQRSSTASDGAALAKKVTARSPAVANYWDTRATCSAAAGDATDAEDSWRRALGLYASAPSADVAERAGVGQRLAQFLVTKRRFDEARTVATAALEFAKGTPAESEIRRFLTTLPADETPR